MDQPILDLSDVTKSYGALRPLRIERLTIAPGAQLALLGLDQPAAEVLINLVTGATLPDSGEVRIFGRSTAAIRDGAEWLAMLDRFGIVSERAALLEPLTVIQNLAMPFSLEIEPPPRAIAEQAALLAHEAGLKPEFTSHRVGDLDPSMRLRVRIGRALALGPSLLVLEHPSAALSRRDAPAVARHVHALARRRGLSTLTITADAAFAGAVADVAVTLEPATGRLHRR
jgi:simple sugar transport system ATP-binding protein